jgi:DNA-binding response OmpR family regulator
MKRRILLVDDEVAVLLTMKAVLEISGFEVETAASAREGKLKLRSREYHMVITDMRMESDVAGHEVVEAARSAPYHPAVALLTAFPVDEGDWQNLGSTKLLLKPMHTRLLLQQIEKLFASHQQKLASLAPASAASPAPKTQKKPAKSPAAKKAVTKSAMPAAKKTLSAKPTPKAPSAPKKAAKKIAAKPAKKVAKLPARSAAKK